MKYITENGLNEVFAPDAADVGIIVQGGMYNTLNRSLELLGLSDAFGATSLPTYVMNVAYPVIDDEVLAFCDGKKAVFLVEEGQPDFLEQNIRAVLHKAGSNVPLHGKDMLTLFGDYTPAVVTRGLAKFLTRYAPEIETAKPTLLTLERRKPTPAELREKELAATAASDPTRLLGPALAKQARRIASSFPQAARLMLIRGVSKTATYQDVAYADRYLDRVARVAAVDPDAAGAATLTVEAARWTALWMCYGDTTAVAQAKIRLKRLEGIRREARAPKDAVVEVREFLHPHVDELADSMPSVMDRALRGNRLFGAGVEFVGGDGILVHTTSLPGYTTLVGLAAMRPLRPRTGRFKAEQVAIDAWVSALVRYAAVDADLAREVAQIPRVLKGYGATHKRGAEAFNKLMAAASELSGTSGAADRLRQRREGALANAG